ncbi:MAG: MgtC/SapB family protein [Bdellovibrionaceae bacterium]|nr:MgtC/SapB family protein [Pseudobdellovibrionaceae bacterium]NUM60379.1 MgtC/SapB family protein [Pseudobdellovibrionaceae bacterium]
MSEIEVLEYLSFKMLFAVICGVAVGYERKINDASASFKTQILVCVGSMLFTVIPNLAHPTTNSDGFRIIAQIISGVGFLGAGAILHKGNTNHVFGLTTAAWIWFTAAIGILIGIDHGPAAIFVTLSLVSVINTARKIEIKYFSEKNKRRQSDKGEKKELKEVA